MLNRTTCPNCGSEVEGATLGWGRDDDGTREFGCDVCVTKEQDTVTVSRAAVIESAAFVLGVAFTDGRIHVPKENYAEALGTLAEAIADRLM